MSASPDILPARTNRAVALRVGVMGLLISMASQFYRNAHVVVAPNIMQDIGVSAQLLGILSAALFLAAALTQLPAGVLIDVYGPRRTLPVMLMTVVCGSLIFATATSGTALIAGRLLMGIGVAALGMASIVACARWFAPEQFGTVVSLVIGLSQIGNVIATAPMAVISDAIGWRTTFLGMTLITAVLGIASYLLIRDAPPGHAYHQRQPENLRAAVRGIGEVLAVPGFYRLLAIAATGYAIISCIIGLWGGPYLHDVHGLDTVARGNILFWLAVGMIIGNVSIGSSDRLFGTRKYIVMVCVSATIAALVGLATFPDAPLPLAAIMLTSIGVLGGHTMVIIVHGRSFYPDRLMGRGVTVVNTAVLGGAAIVQGLTGFIAGILQPGASDLPIHAYQIIFTTLAAVLGVALIIYSGCPDKKPGPRAHSDID